MRTVLKDENVLKNCKIAQMLQNQPPHLSFHTPGHKCLGWDITELAYSDNLASPTGCIAEAEKDIASILGAQKSFILTDGSTSGVLAMLYAAKSLGAKRILTSENAHKSVFNGCAALGLELLLYPAKTSKKIPLLPTMYALKCEYPTLLESADALLFTSPDYYGNVADLQEIRRYCDQTKKLLLIDGAHGGHLHFHKEIYAGAYADMWVDGVHKSLPAFTQGAVVSARTQVCADALQKGVDIFRTTSPSYPIMASVEYAVKYPQNTELEKAVKAFANSPRIYHGADWTKLCALFGKNAFAVEKILQNEGIYAEFCDGNVLCFYLSPATELADFERLKNRLEGLFLEFPLTADEEMDGAQAVRAELLDGLTEWLPLDEAVGRVSAEFCGLFPPCTPLLSRGEIITSEKIDIFKRATHTFGLKNRKIAVWKGAKKE